MGEARHTDVDLARTKRELVHCLDAWPGAEYVSIGDYRDQDGDEAVVVFRFNGNLVRIVLTLDSLRLAYKRGLGASGRTPRSSYGSTYSAARGTPTPRPASASAPSARAWSAATQITNSTSLFDEAVPA
ncbi:MAG TPA: hypothetical protein VFB20_15685 [Burkholderiales bacterium]|nr:hypothetical protein [Burkholderiales bacterium]